MPSKLNSKVLQRINLNKNKNVTQVTTQFYKDKDKLISSDDLYSLIDRFNEKGNNAQNNFDITLVRVLNGSTWVTFNDMDMLEDYFNGKVKDPTKFYDFNQVNITCVFS